MEHQGRQQHEANIVGQDIQKPRLIDQVQARPDALQRIRRKKWGEPRQFGASGVDEDLAPGHREKDSRRMPDVDFHGATPAGLPDGDQALRLVAAGVGLARDQAREENKPFRGTDESER